MEERTRYFKQVETNQSYIRKCVDVMNNPPLSLKCSGRWLSPSPVNTSTWVALIVRVTRPEMFAALTDFLGRGAGIFDEQP